jgi:protein O-mannosyl-transferase
MASSSKKKRKAAAGRRRKTEPAKNLPPVTGFPWKKLLRVGVILTTVGWIFSPVFHGDWLWDDDILIRGNLLVHHPAGLWKIWFDPTRLVDYFPLKASIEWIEWHLWGDDTLGHHLVSIGLHAVNSLLVWKLLNKFGLRLAWLGGLLFALHPIMIESVAWISEFKNTLSLAPFLLAVCAYLDYEERGRRSDYLRALVLFVIAMLCKTTMVMFPVVLLLYAWWKRDRIGWGDLKRSGPFFAVSLALGLITIWFVHQHAIGEKPIEVGGLFSRVALAGLSIAFYLSKCLLPVALSPIYQKWDIDPPGLVQFLPWLVLGGLLFYLWRKRHSWGRHLLLGLGFFLITLAPFVGVTTASYMTFTWVMDHILYLPIIGLVGLAMAGLGQLDERISSSARPYGQGMLAIVFALLAYLSHSYAGIFVSSKALWTYTIKVNPGAFVAYNQLGTLLSHQGRYAEAIEQFQRSLRLNPDFVFARFNLAGALQEMGRFPEAMEEYERVIALDPILSLAYNNMGNILISEGHVSEAKQNYERALQYNPEFPDAHNNLGNILTHESRLPEALEQYNEALDLDPSLAAAHNSKGVILAKTGDLTGAIKEFQETLKINPNNPNARNNLEQVQRIQAPAPPQ